MEDSFKVRVDKVFGSLNTSSSSSLSSLWCLTDDEIERRQWNRDKGIIPETPQPYHHTDLEKDLQDLDDDDDDDDEVEYDDDDNDNDLKAKPDDYNDEEWQVKSSIGKDCTLDFEEEEDEYDKVAVGKEKPQDKDGVYMKEIDDDYGIDIDSGNVLPTSFKHVIKDPRANHLAAKLRLKEDDEAAAQKIDSLRVSELEEDTDTNTLQFHDVPSNPRSILKRKDNPLDAKSHKRVRFDPECKDNGDTETQHKEVADAENFASGVPDYLLNPSRYTHYTFDSLGEVDDESNKQAYLDFMNLLKKSNASAEDQDDSFYPSRPVTFIPRKKNGDTSAMVDSCTELVQQVGIGRDVTVRQSTSVDTARIAAVDAEETDVSAMEEDEPESMADGRSSLQKPGRQYRMKARPASDE